MKKRIFKLSALLCLVLLAVSMLSVSAFAAGESEEVGFLEKWIGPVHEWIDGVAPSVLDYIDNVPTVICILFGLNTLAAWVKYAVLLGVLAALAIVLIFWIIAIFKRRFFRSFARTVNVAVIVWLVTFAGYVAAYAKVLSEPKQFGLDVLFSVIHETMKSTMPNLYGLVSGLTNPIWLVPVGFLVACVLVIVLMSIIIASSKKREKKCEDALALAAPEVEPIAIPEVASVEEPVVEAVAAVSVDEVAEPAAEAEEPADVAEEAPAEEAVSEETVAEDAVTEETAADEEAVEKEAIAVEEAVAEEAVEDEPAAPAYPLLPEPVFMPVPSTVFDIVDFTDPSRDGFTLRVSVAAAEAAALMSDEQVEDLTAIVYRTENGPVAEIGLDCLSANFKPYAYVDAKILRRLGLISADAKKLSVVASGVIDKPLMIEASELSVDAIKMITLAGGRAIRVL